jgi:tetratricopeptide (TPR) repeat protein
MAAPKGSVLAVKKSNAVQLLRAGKLDEAEALLQQVCAKRPDDQDAWMLRSTIHGMRGQHDRVLECSGRVMAMNPDNTWALSHQGSALAALGRRDESIEVLKKARDLIPDDPAVLSNLGNALYLAERVEEAEPCFRRALEINPRHLESHYGLGHVLSALGLSDEAIVSYHRAAQLDPNRYPVLFGLGTAYLNTGRLDDAKAFLQRALRVAENPLEALIFLSRVERVTGQYEEALVHLQEALRRDPDSVAAAAEQAEIYQRQGDREKAHELIREMVDQEIVAPIIIAVYSYICRYFDECDEVVRLGERLLTEKGLGRGDRAAVHFALGDVLNGMGDYDGAFSHYRQGNELTPHRFDRAADTREVDGLIAGYSRAAMPGLPRARNASELPVFIVGMPRSGTSLVEQILASHSRVHGAGELADITGLAHHLGLRFQAPYYERLGSVDGALLDEFAEGHLHHLKALGGEADRVTDKMPHNFRHLGLIGQLFPRARVIHCTRDPRDTCLSIYFQRFSGSHSYAWELGDLAYYYNDYQRLMRHWQQVLEIEMIEVNYERLVGDLEREARRMIEFVGLEWDERCLAFHETQRPVATASFDQVRQPLYTSSIARWRQYERHLGPLIEGLALPEGG